MIFNLGKGRDVRNTFGVTPHCTVFFKVPNRGDGNCHIFMDDVQVLSGLAYVGK